MVGYIYRITNKITNQHYIGQTIDINRRRRTHFNTLKNNSHENPKLQLSWNKYGAENFEFESWEFTINSADELNKLECDYINKYNALDTGFNLVPGGGKPPIHQKINDEDIATFLCVFDILGDGYGKTCEQIFGWAKGTASAAKRHVRYLNGWSIYEKMSEAEKLERGQDFINSQHLKEQALQRQLTQGGCKKAYELTQNDYNFAFAARDLNYTYTAVAAHFDIKSTTVKDWFNGRSRVKESQLFANLSDNDKSIYYEQVKNAKLEQYMHDKLQNKNEDDILDYLCYIQFFPTCDAAIEHLYGWSSSTCHHIRLSNTYPYTKAKFSILTEEEQHVRANKLNNQLVGHA